MYGASIEGREVTLVVTLDELRLINVALHDAVTRAPEDEQGFQARLTAPRADYEALLRCVHSVLRGVEEHRIPERRTRETSG